MTTKPQKLTRERFLEIWLAGSSGIASGRWRTLSHLMQSHEVQEIHARRITMPRDATFMTAFHALWQALDPTGRVTACRLTTGQRVLNLPPPRTTKEIEDQIWILHDGITALRSLHGMGPRAQQLATKNMRELERRYDTLLTHLSKETACALPS